MRKHTSAYIWLILVAVIWGANFGMSRWGMELFPAEIFVFLRFGMAVPLLFLVLYWKEGSVRVEPRDIPKMLLIAFVGVTLLEILVLYSIDYTTLANASLLNVAPWPIFTALFAPLFHRERITKHLVIGGIAALAGVSIVIVGGEAGLDFGSQHMLGNLMALAVSLLGAIYNLACMPLMKRYSPLHITTWLSLFGVLFLVPFTWNQWELIQWSNQSFIAWFSLFYNVVLCTVMALVIWNGAMKKIGATRANFYRYLIPAIAVISGAIFFDEPILPVQIGGGIIILLGLVWISAERTNKTATKHPQQERDEKQIS